jgi:hypothetical protein
MPGRRCDPAQGMTAVPSEALRGKFRFFEEFWSGAGPCPVLFARPHLARGRPYIRHDLVEQHRDPEKQLEERLLEIEPHLELIDDGIPTLRADLGTTLLASGLGLPVTLQPELHPWPAGHLDAAEYAARRLPFSARSLRRNELLFALRCYKLFTRRRRRGRVPETILPYVPDTQGVFDLSHLIVGTGLFTLLLDRPEQALAVQERSLSLFMTATRLFKKTVGEADTSMIHGHGMPIGAWFPRTGARISEDSATLISEAMIRRFCLPYIVRASRPFGRLFMHFCGHHPGFLRLLCERGEISTLNLGNPELYDLEELFALCGRSGTVYFGHLPPLAGEDGLAYLERLAGLCRRHRTRLILVAETRPRDGAEKADWVRRWHRLTG